MHALGRIMYERAWPGKDVSRPDNQPVGAGCCAPVDLRPGDYTLSFTLPGFSTVGPHRSSGAGMR